MTNQQSKQSYAQINSAIKNRDEGKIVNFIKSELKHATEESAIGAQQFFAVSTYVQLMNAMYLEYEQVLKRAADDLKRLEAQLPS